MDNFGLRGLGLRLPPIKTANVSVLQKKSNGFAMGDDAKQFWRSGVSGLESLPLGMLKCTLLKQNSNGFAMADEARSGVSGLDQHPHQDNEKSA